MDPEQKAILYAEAEDIIRMYICVQGDIWARLATVEAVLHSQIPYFFWTGVYALIDGDLIVRSYQGPVACQYLKSHSGVCWAAVDTGKVQIVEDVDKFPGHIACSSSSRSEIVLPLEDADGNLYGCFDVDSMDLGAFDETDCRMLSRILELIK